ncbi:MAG TPA: F0F1 ATP synthase subunit A, partial [Dehalococcoidia bacterium]|nr:F0F1 ATP synthase subunit A [Dehalococcoidia bacterium]
MKRLVIIGALIYTVVTVLLSIFLLKPPQPIIEIKGEPLIEIAPSSNEILSFSITNTLLTAWIIMALLLIICFAAVRKRQMIPSGFYNAFEAVIELIFNFVTGIAGEKNGRRFFPLIATLLIYIAFANWMSLTPVFNTFGIFVPLHAEEAKFHEDALVFKDSGGVSLIAPGADFVELEAEECVTGHEGDECREHAIEAATEEHAGEGE